MRTLMLPESYYISQLFLGSPEPAVVFVPTPGQKVEFPGYEEFDFFLHEIGAPPRIFRISEGMTGAFVAEGKSEEEVKKVLLRCLKKRGSEKVRKIIEKALAKQPLSPRYVEQNG